MITIKNILFPKDASLTGKKKPKGVVICYARDVEDNAVKYSCKLNQLSNSGFYLMHKTKISLESFEKDRANLKKTGPLKTNITVFLNTHGLPGRLFGEKASLDSELSGLYEFAQCIRDIEQHTGTIVDNIVLSACYSAVEIHNAKSGRFLLSPARLLSMIFPDKNVVGFIGQYADAVVTHIYVENRGEFSPVVKKPFQAAVLFKNGQAHEKPSETIYYQSEYIPDFIRSSLSLTDLDERSYVKAELVEMIKKGKLPFWYDSKAKSNPGLKQQNAIVEIKNVLENGDETSDLSGIWRDKNTTKSTASPFI